jgi:hypothetical protein
MRLAIGRRLLAIIPLVVALASPLVGQEQPRAADGRAAAPSVGSPAPSSPPKVLTGKERLGEKWKDEQRIDNCNVPIEKRGPKPRPDTCGPTG